jgi:Lon protease-like protein
MSAHNQPPNQLPSDNDNQWPIWLPLFPLGLVAYPGQPLNLHVFEPRYRELVADLGVGGCFGISPFLDGQVMSFGTVVRIIEITDKAEDGKCNIRTLGVSTYRTDMWENPWSDKLYAAARVSHQEDNSNGSPVLEQTTLHLRDQLFALLGVIPPEVVVLPGSYLSYATAGKLGLSVQQEAILLMTETENLRLAFLIAHLEHILPVLEQTERTKVLVQSNGHFKELGPLGF